MRPIVTVGIPTFNRPAQLAEAIASVAAQSYIAWRLVVSDNANLPENARIVESFTDERMTYVGQPNDLGPVGNFNYLLSACQTPFCAILHDDDLYESDYLERMIEAMACLGQADWAFCDAVWGDPGERSEATSCVAGSTVLIDSGDEFCLQVLSGAVRIPCPTVMFRMETVGKERFDPKHPAACDLDLWLRLARRYPAAYVPAAMVRYRVWDGSDSMSPATLGQIIVDTIGIKDDTLCHPLPTPLRHATEAQFALRVRRSCRNLLMSSRLADGAQAFPAVRRALARQPGAIPRLTRTLLSHPVLIRMMLLLQPVLRVMNRRP